MNFDSSQNIGSYQKLITIRDLMEEGGYTAEIRDVVDVFELVRDQQFTYANVCDAIQAICNVV